MIAILSDIHGNLEAITAVLADIALLGVSEIYNLGDTLGYGPNPIECLDLAMWMKVNLLGNFDYAVLNSPEHFCTGAKKSILWTQTQLMTVGEADKQKQRRAFLESITASFRKGDVLFVHGSASRPLNEYLFREDTYNHQKMERIWASFDRICFSGHTHVPGIFLKKNT